MSFEADNWLPARRGLLPAVKEFLEILGYKSVLRPTFFWREEVLATMSLFREDQYRSFSGVYLHLSRGDDQSIGVYTRTNAWCSHWDLDQQIRTVRLLRKHFGGWFRTDRGRNKYWRNDQREMSAAEAGCFLAFERFEQNIDRAVRYLDDRKFPAWPPNPMLKQINFADSRLFSNNLLLPYLVASLEDYFKSAFIALASSLVDKETLLKNARILPERLVRVAQGEARIEEAVADAMSFQNLAAIYGYFRGLDRRIDFAGHLRRRSKRSRNSLHDALEAVIARRHHFVHRNIVDPGFEERDLAKAIDDLYAAVRRCHEHLSVVHGWSVEHPRRSWTARRRLRIREERETVALAPK